jgi:hypothetical protein
MYLLVVCFPRYKLVRSTQTRTKYHVCVCVCVCVCVVYERSKIKLVRALRMYIKKIKNKYYTRGVWSRIRVFDK